MDDCPDVLEILPVVGLVAGIAGELPVFATADTPPIGPFTRVRTGIHAVLQKIGSLAYCDG